MAIYELEQRVLFDGAAAVATAEAVVDAMQTVDSHDSNSDSTQTSSADVTHSDSSHADSSDSSSQSTDSQSADNHQLSTDNETQLYIDGITGHTDAIANDSAPNVLVVSEMVKDYNALANSANDNTIVVKLSSCENLDTLLSDITNALHGEKASSIGFAVAGENDGSIKLTTSETLTADSVFSDSEQNAFFTSLNDVLAENGSIDLLTSDLASTDSGNQLIENIDSIVHPSEFNVHASADETGNDYQSTTVNHELDWFLENGNVDAKTKYFDTDKLTDFSGELALSYQYGGEASEVLFINTSVLDSQKIVDSLGNDVEVVYLESGKDGIQQITDYLSTHDDISAIHIVSHGGDGYIVLNGQVIDSNYVESHSSEFAQWQKSLTPNADILIYGCDVAKDDVGKAFVSNLADVTGADVAASIDGTGIGGDWDLEYHTGVIDTGAIFVASYDYHLTSYLVNVNTDTGSGSETTGDLRYCITQANLNAGSEITFALTAGNETITIGSQLSITASMTIDGDNTAGSGTDVTVQVTTPGTSTWRVFYINASTSSADHPITISHMTIKGGNISGLSGSARFGGGIYIVAGTVELNNVVVTLSKAGNGGGIYNSGTLTLNSSTISNNTAQYPGGSYSQGGGICNSGTLTLNSSTISNNTATSKYQNVQGGGIYNSGNLYIGLASTVSSNNATYTATGEYSAYGAGIYNYSGTFTLDSSTVSNNIVNSNSSSASSFGGGIYSSGGTLTINSSEINENSVSCIYAYGGGIDCNYSLLTITSSTISNNHINCSNLAMGGGIYYYDNSTNVSTITSSTISGNNITNSGTNFNNGGGIYIIQGHLVITSSAISGNTITAGLSRAYGGGIYIDNASLTISSSTISGNSASSTSASQNVQGGGIYKSSGTLTITSSTISSNTASSTYPAKCGGIYSSAGNTYLLNTIIINNASNYASGKDIYVALGNTYAYYCWYNSIIGLSTNASAPNIINAYNGDLGALADNGGSTYTMALLTGCPAIGAGTFVYYNTTDGYYFYDNQSTPVAHKLTNWATVPTNPQPTDKITTDQRGVTISDPPDIGAWNTGEILYYYMAKNSGDWNTSSGTYIWYKNTVGGTDASTYTTATYTAPTENNSLGIIINDDVSVTISTGGFSIDQTTVNTGASIIVSSDQTLTIADGAGTDLANYGTVTVNGTLTNNGQFSNAVVSSILDVNTNNSLGDGTLANTGTIYASASAVVLPAQLIGGTVIYDGTSAQAIDTTGTSYTDLQITTSAGNTVTAAGTLTVVNLTSSATMLNVENITVSNILTLSGQLEATGSVSLVNDLQGEGVFIYGGIEGQAVATVEYYGLKIGGTGAKILAGDVTVNDSMYIYDGAGLNVSSNNLTVDNAVTLAGTGAGLTISTGNVVSTGDFNSANLGSVTITGAGTLTLGGANNGLGTFTGASGSTVIYNRAGDQTIAAGDYYNLTVSGSGNKTLGGTVTVNDALISSAGITFLVNGNTLNLGGTWTNNAIFDSTGTVNYTKTGDQNIITSVIYSNFGTSGSGTKSTAGTLIILGNLVADADISANALSVSGISSTGANITTSGAQDYTGAITLTGDSTFTGSTITFNDNVSGTYTLSTAGNVVTNDVGIALSGLSVNSGTFNSNSDTGTWDIGNVTIASGATLNATTGAFNVSGNWTDSGTFTHNNATVEFDGTTQSIGAETFYNLTTSGTGTQTLGGAVTVENTLNTGDGTTFALGANTLNIGSENAGTGEWIINEATFEAGTGTVNYADTANQTILALNYYGLGLNGLGSTKTFSDGTTSVAEEILIEIDGTINLTGSSADNVTVQVTNPGENGTASRVFHIFGFRIDNIVNISNITIEGGDISANSDNSGYGGGIYVEIGALNIENSEISGSKAYVGGGLYVDQAGSLTVINSTISGNSASASGGGIYCDSTTTITTSTISGNSASASGGGIYSNGLSVTITTSTISGNSASVSGGGIYCAFGDSFIISSSTIGGNNASVSGGGIYADTGMLLTNSIVAYNYSGTSGSYAYTDITKGTFGSVSGNYNISGYATITGGNNFTYNYGSDGKGTGGSGSLFYEYNPIEVGAVYVPLLKNNGGTTETIALAVDTSVARNGCWVGTYEDSGMTMYAFSSDKATWYKVVNPAQTVAVVSEAIITQDQRGVTIIGDTPCVGAYNLPLIYYMAKNSGNWSNNLIWYINFTGGTDPNDYVTQASGTPTAGNSSGIIINNNVVVDQDVTIDQTTVNNSYELEVAEGITLTVSDRDGTDLLNDGTITVNGTLANAGQFTNNLILDINTNNSLGSGTLTNAGTIYASASAVVLPDQLIAGTVIYDGANQVIDNATYNNLTVSGSGTKTLNGTVTVENNLDTATGTTLALGANTLNIGSANAGTGNWTINTAGFIAGTGTVNYAETGAQTVADTAYYNLTVSGSGTKTVNHATTTIAGTGTISGTAQVLISVTAAGVDKVYDGNTTATVVLSIPNNIFEPFYTVTPGTYTANFDTKNAGANKPISVTGITLGGPNSAKYSCNTTSSTTATITAKALTMSGLTVPASKIYDGTTAAVVSGTAAFTGSENAGEGTTSDGKWYTGDTVSFSGTAVGTYNSKDVATASSVTFSGLSLTGAQSGNYTLTIQSPASATITAKTVTLSATKIYDGTTDLTDDVTITTGVGAETLNYTGATASDAHVATANKYISAITLADNGAFLASNYALPTLNVANAPVTITAATLTPTISNTGVTKVYNGNTDAPEGFTPTYTFAGLVSGDTAATLAYTSAAYNDKDVVDANKVTVSGLSISAITGTNTSAASDYVLDAMSKDVAATITAKTVTLSATKIYDGTTDLTDDVTITTGVGAETLNYTGATASDAHVATANKYISAITLADNGAFLASNYALPTLNVANAPVTITAATLTPTISNTGVTKVYNGNTDAPEGFTPTYTFAGLVSGDTAATLAYTSAAYNDKDVVDANKVTVSGLSISAITGTNTSAASDYVLDAMSKDVAATITAKTVTLSATKIYDGTTDLTDDVTITTGVGAETLNYTGATASDAHVATANKYISAITLADNGAFLASNYALPTLNVANAPVTITAATLTPTISNTGVTKVYNGNTDAPEGFTPTYTFAGLVSGDTAATLAYTSAAYNDKDVVDANKVTVSGLSISAITGTNTSAASDYVLDAMSKDVAATITAKTVTLSATKIYDGTTYLTDDVTITTGVGAETLNYTGATASDAHVATANKYISAITLADNGAFLASNYALPTLNVANAPVTITAATLTPTISNTGVTKVYNGNTDAPEGFTPTYTFAGLVSGDTAATLAYTSAAYNDKDVVDANKVTVSGLSISAITGTNTSAASDYVLDAMSKDVAATITAKTVTLSATKIYDGTTDLTDDVTITTGVGAETLNYTGATASDAHVATANKYISAITLADNGAFLASNYALPTLNVANAPVTITAATLTPTISNTGVTKVYNGNTDAPEGFTPTYTFAGLVSGDTAATLAYTSAAYNDKDVVDANKVTVSGLSISAITGTNTSAASDYVLDAMSKDVAATITAKTVTLSATKIYDGTTDLTDDVTITTGVGAETLNYTGATASDAHVATANKYISAITLADNGAFLASNYALPTLNVANAPVTITAATLTPTISNTGVTKVYNGNTDAPEGFTPTYTFAGLVSGDTAATLAYTSAAYNDKDVVDANKVTVSGLSISAITGTNTSAASDYVLDAMSKDVAATITAKTVTLSATKIYDGTTYLTDDVTITTGVGAETLNYTGATASDAHVATANKYISAITLADNGAFLASNYALPTLNVANAPVTITAATLTPTISNTGVTKVYNGNTDAPEGFTPTYTFAGLVSGDTAATLAYTSAAYNDKDVVDANKVTVSGLSISAITGTNTSAASDYVLDAMSKDVAATITAKTVTLSATKIYDGTTDLTDDVTITTGVGAETLNYTGATASDAHVATANKYISAITLADNGAFLASNYALPTLNVANAPVTITAATLTPTISNTGVTKVYNGNTDAPEGFTPTYTFAGLVSGDTAATLAYTSAAYNDKDVVDANKVTVSGLSISAITGTNTSAASDYVLDAMSKDVAATITAKTVTLSATKIYDGTTDLTDDVTITTGVGAETLNYTGATASDAHVATANKYISAITLADNGAFLASNYALPTLNVANAPVTITAATLTPTISNTGVTKVYNGNTDAPEGFTPTYTFAGLVSGDTAATLAYTSAAYNDKDVVDANKVTVSGLSISAITGTNTSAASDYVLDAMSKDVAATITAKTVTLSATKIYDGTTYLTDDVTITTGVGAETLNYTGATASDAHVATANKYISAITLADNGAFLASNYALPTLNVANAPVTITAATLTPTISNTGVTKVYNGNTDAPEGFTPTYTFAGLVSGDTAATLAYTSAAYNDKDVVDANKVTVSGLSISAITGTNTSAASDYVLDAMSKDVAATITAKTVTLSATKIYDGTTYLTDDVTITTGVGAETLNYTGATASDAHVATANKYISAITLADNGAFLASNYALPTLNVANAPVTITAATLTPTISNTGVTKVYNGNTDAPEGFTPTYTFAGLVSGDTAATLAYTSAAYNDKDVVDANKVTVSVLSISAITGTNTSAASDYVLDAMSKDVAATITAKTVTLSATKIYDGTTDLTDDVTITTGVGAETLNYTGATASDAHVATANKYISAITLADNGAFLASNYALPTLNVANAPVTITAATLTPTISNTGVTKVYNGNTDAPEGFTPTYTFAGLVSGDTAATLAYTSAAYNYKDVVDANKVTVSVLSISAITGTNTSAASDYVLDATSKDVAATITAKTVTLSATKIYDGTTYLTDDVTITTGVGAETLNYTGATASDAHVATANKYISAITLADNGAFLASNYALPTLNVANAPVTITAATLTPTISNTGVTKVYNGNTDAPEGFTPTYTFAGLVSGDTAATLAYTSAAYNDKDVVDANKVTVSGLSISAITGTNTSAASDYVLDAMSKDVAATITAKTVTLSATKIYDGTTDLTDDVTITTGVGAETLNYTGATASDAHVATANKYISAITLADNGAFLASNYALPTLNVANAPVTITAATLTPTISNTGVTKVYNGNTDAPEGFTPTYTFAGLVSGDTAATLAYTSAAYNYKDVVDANKVTVSGLSISAITGTNTSAASDYVLDAMSKDVAATITAKTLTVSATGINKVYDGNTTATVTLGDDRVAGDVFTDAYTTATFADKDAAANKTVSVSGISISGTDAANYTLASTSATTTADITARTLTVSATGINKVYDGNTTATVTLGDDRVAGDVFTDAYTTATFADKDAAANKTVSVSGISISGTDAANYTLASTTATTTADITARTLTVSATGINKVYDGNTTATVTLGDDRVAGDVFTDAYTTATFADKDAAANKTVSVSGISISGTDAANYTLASTTATTTADITAKDVTIIGVTATKIYDANLDGTTALDYSSATIDGNLDGANLTINNSADTGTYDNKNVGMTHTVTITGVTLSGLEAGNYNLTAQPTIINGIITAKVVTLSGTKVYDGNATFTGGTNLDAATGVGTETLVLSGTASANSKDVGIGVDLNDIGSLALADGTNGGLASNYTLTSATLTDTVSITAKELTISADNINKFYGKTLTNGTNYTRFTTDGLAIGDQIDSVTVTYGAGATAEAAVGNYVGSIVVSDAVGDAFNSNNYDIIYNPGNIEVLSIDNAYYKTVDMALGAWSNADNWLVSEDGVAWESASIAPTVNSLEITITSTADITVGSDLEISKTVVDAGGALTVASGVTLSVVDYTGVDLTINGDLIIESAGRFVLGDDTLVDIDGSLNSAGTVSFSSSGEDNGELYISCSAAELGTLVAGHGTVVYDGGGQTVDTATYYNFETAGSGTKITTGDITVNNDLGVGTGTMLDIGDHNISVDVDTVITGTLAMNDGTFDAKGGFDATGGIVTFGTAGEGELQLGGDVAGLGDFTAGHSTVTYDGADQTIDDVTYYNLETAGTGILTVAGEANIMNDFTLYSGIVDIGNNNLLVHGSIVQGNPFSSANMVATSGSGCLYNYVSADGSYVLPVGTINVSTGLGEYSPITITLAGASYSSGAYLNTRVLAEKDPNAPNAENYINRYWVVESSGISGYNADVTCQYLPGDVVGDESAISGHMYSGNSWSNLNKVDESSHTFTGSVVRLGDFTAYTSASRNNNAQMNDGTTLSTVLDNTASPMNSSSYPDANFGVNPWDKMMKERGSESLFGAGYYRGTGVLNSDTENIVYDQKVSKPLDFDNVSVKNARYDDDTTTGENGNEQEKDETAMIFEHTNDYLAMIAGITDGESLYSIKLEKHALFKTSTDIYLDAIAAGQV